MGNVIDDTPEARKHRILCGGVASTARVARKMSLSEVSHEPEDSESNWMLNSVLCARARARRRWRVGGVCHGDGARVHLSLCLLACWYCGVGGGWGWAGNVGSAGGLVTCKTSSCTGSPSRPCAGETQGWMARGR